MNKASDQDLWKSACAAIQEVQAYSKEEHDAYMRGGRPFFPMISTGGGTTVMTTEAGIEAIAEIGEGWRIADKDRKARIEASRMRQVAVSEFGRMLADNNMEFWPDVITALQDFKVRLDLRLKQIARDVEHYFPCCVLESSAAPSFEVGAIRFMRRDEWLSHIDQRAGKGQEGWSNLARRAWCPHRKETLGIIALRKLREASDAAVAWIVAELKLKPPSKSHLERQTEDIVEAVGPCQWVAVVHVVGNELGRSQERARNAVRLALDALGMVLSASQARNLRGPGDEKMARHHVTMSQFEGLGLNIGHHMDVPQLFAHPPFAEKFISNTVDLREAAGWAIQCLLRPPDEIDFPALKRRWCDALYWFGDARRDASDFSALVRYGICLDVLAKGRKANGIMGLVADLQGGVPGDKLLSDGTSIQSVITTIYNDGRSQLGHGGRPALLEDLPIDRGIADQVAARTLDLCLCRLRSYKGPDDIDAFLSAIPALTAGVRAAAASAQPPPG
jgi:hypothetical protein